LHFDLNRATNKEEARRDSTTKGGIHMRPKNPEKERDLLALTAVLLSKGRSTREIASRLERSPRRILDYKRTLIDAGLVSIRITDEELAERGRRLLKCGRYEPEHVRWAREIERHFRRRGRRTRIEIVPVHEYSNNSWKQLNALGATAARVLAEYVCDGAPHHALVGLGKHVNSVCQSMPKATDKNDDIAWLPSMPTYGNLPFFNANEFCGSLQRRLGGHRPVTLEAPGFIRTGEEELLHVYRTDESHVRLFGGTLKTDPDLSPANETNQVTGVAWGADTALAGCGVAARGNPLIETRFRFRNRRRLREAPCPAVGDLNGFYLCVRPDGEPVAPSADADHPDDRNREAWDANRRALGADLTLYQQLAERHRREERRRGAGVVLVANTQDRAPIVYSVLRLGLVNTLVMDHFCARKLREILSDPARVVAAVPEEVAF